MRLEYIHHQLLPEVTLESYTSDRLKESWIELLTTEKAFHLFVPKQFGGLELSMSQGILALTSVAKIQGSLGWVLNLGAGANYCSTSKYRNTPLLKTTLLFLLALADQQEQREKSIKSTLSMGNGINAQELPTLRISLLMRCTRMDGFHLF